MTSCIGTLDLGLIHPRATPRTRREEGRQRRETVPLEAHAELSGEAGRPDPLTILAQQDTTRVPRLVPIRYGRMSRT
ncbi:MAG: DUF2252 domain-containing protein, partial [Pseudomonadota bacterium]|nr:DUF2252 domain-containing protein [Pseudomonadota bacterium]